MRCFKEFEDNCESIKHKVCECCRTISITTKGIANAKNKGTCQRCKNYKDKNYYIKNHYLPVWYKNGDKKNKPNYRVPTVLSSLSQAEKMLIQRVSPFLSLHHIKNGTCGLQGHVCAFEQDVTEFITRLPRCREDTTILRIIKSIKTEIGNTKRATKKAFIVRQEKIEAGKRNCFISIFLIMRI